jgi:phosphotransferase system HPr (HPr) family protein
VHPPSGADAQVRLAKNICRRARQDKKTSGAISPQEVFILVFHDKMMGQEPVSMTTAVEKELWVENRLGLHARPVAKIATMAQQYDAEITLEKDGLVANARDLLDVLALDCPQGTRLVLRASGPQAREAASQIAALFARKFEEK